VRDLFAFPLFVPALSRLAIGNETDMLHPANTGYLVDLLALLNDRQLPNTIALITKAPISGKVLNQIRSMQHLHVVFCLSYSGLGQRFEPNFTIQSLRANFSIVREFGFPIVHFWRPLLPDNTSPEAIEDTLSFVAPIANASVFVGFKLHPELTQIVKRNDSVAVPSRLANKVGEWLETDTIRRIYDMASRICPDYPLYRHTSCALAKVAGSANHTGTVYRMDICPPSQCPDSQRRICQLSRRVPSEQEVAAALSHVDRAITFKRNEDGIVVQDKLTQQEYSFLVQQLSCPVLALNVEMENLYYGSIHEPGWTPSEAIPSSSS
jgi:hypothetical protein